MTIHFQVGIQETKDSYDVHTLYECDTERGDVGSSEVTLFQTLEGALGYMKEQLEEYERSLN